MMIRFAFLFLLVACSSMSFLAAQPVLKGHVTHTASLKPVARDLRPGKTFVESALVEGGSVNRWFRIPDWLAGTWLESTQTSVFRQDLVAGTKDRRMKVFIAKGQEPWGEQMDAAGGIWQYVRLGQTTILEGKDNINYGHIRLVEPISVNEKVVMVRVELLNLSVRKESREIIEVSQQEQIMSYSPRGASVIKVSGSIRSYDKEGRPLKTAHSVYVAERIKKFTPLDRIGDLNLENRFYEYLTSHGLANLIP